MEEEKCQMNNFNFAFLPFFFHIYVYCRPYRVYATHVAALDHSSIPVYIVYFLDAKAST